MEVLLLIAVVGIIYYLWKKSKIQNQLQGKEIELTPKAPFEITLFKKHYTISENENEITVEDDYDEINYYFNPESKSFTSSFLVKNDAFAGESIYEYKLSNKPIIIAVRLLSKSFEPPLRFEVKDGVVLESDIKKEVRFMVNERIRDLKKEVEWHNVEIINNFIVFFFILSKHPEIIPQEEYRRFLRQTEQKIKMGLLKIEEGLKEKEAEGLQIIEDDFGFKNIDYPDGIERPEKQIKKVEKLINLLFDKNSDKYCGISRNEFSSSSGTLEYIDKLLGNED